MKEAWTIHCPVSFARRDGNGPSAGAGRAAKGGGRLPRVTRLLALALRLEEQVRHGELPDYKAIATVGEVSRARVSQILNLVLLAPDIQEEILFLPLVRRGRDPIHLALLQPLAAIPEWTRQRRRWLGLKKWAMPEGDAARRARG